MSEVVFGDGGDCALESSDDRLKFALLFRLDLFDGLGHLFGPRATRETPEGRGEQRRGCAQNATRPAERDADCALHGLYRRLAADDGNRLAHVRRTARVEYRSAVGATLHCVVDEVAEVVCAAREVNGALPFEEVEDFSEDSLQRVDEQSHQTPAHAPALAFFDESTQLPVAQTTAVCRGEASHQTLAEIVLREVVNHGDGDERRQTCEHGVRDEAPLFARLRSL